MSRLLTACASVLLFAPLALLPAAPVPPRKPILFHPTTEARWVYRSYGVEDRVGHDVVEVVMSVRHTDGVAYVGLGFVFEGQKRDGGAVIAVSAKGLAQGCATQGGGFAPTAELLRVPSVPGETWVIERDKAQVDKEQRYTSRGPEEVEVPAGKFQALRVDTEYVYRDGTSRKDRTWYAPGVGVVKWEGDEGRSKVLKSFEPGR
jgi:hypothetical protein